MFWVNHSPSFLVGWPLCGIRVEKSVVEAIVSAMNELRICETKKCELLCYCIVLFNVLLRIAPSFCHLLTGRSLLPFPYHRHPKLLPKKGILRRFDRRDIVIQRQ